MILDNMRDLNGDIIEEGQSVLFLLKGKLLAGEVLYTQTEGRKIVERFGIIAQGGYSRKTSKIPAYAVVRCTDKELLNRDYTINNPTHILILNKEYKYKQALERAAREIYENFNLYTCGLQEQNFIDNKVKEWLGEK